MKNIGKTVAPVSIQTSLVARFIDQSVFRHLFTGHLIRYDHLSSCMPPTHFPDQHISEAFVADDVDDKVDGRVEDDEHVGDMPLIEQVAATGTGRVGRQEPQHSGNEGGHLTYDGHYTDDYENERHRVFIRTA